MSETTRIPPQATEVEMEVLGAMLIEQGAAPAAFQRLQTRHFYNPFHRDLFETMLQLYLDNKPLDLLTVEQRMMDEGLIDKETTHKLSDLTRSVSSVSNIEYHVQIIIEKHIKRDLIKKCSRVIKNAYDSGSDAYDVLDLAQELIFELSETDQGRTHHIADTMNRVIQDLMNRIETGVPLGIKAGFSFDDLTQGFQKGKFYVLAARPSMGKTALALDIMRRVARSGNKVAILSLETSDQSLGYRFLSQESGVDGEKLLSGNLTNFEKEKAANAAGKLSGLGIHIDDTLTLSDVQFRSLSRKLKQQYKTDMLLVDYVQLLKGKGYSENQEVANVSRMCKVVAKELNIPVIALAQLSRDVEKRGGDRRPVLSDLRASGQIEQDADVAMFMYRPEYYGIKTDHQGRSTAGICEIIVAKNKDGATGTKVLEFDMPRMRFNNIDPLMRGRTP